MIVGYIIVDQQENIVYDLMLTPVKATKFIEYFFILWLLEKTHYLILLLVSSQLVPRATEVTARVRKPVIDLMTYSHMCVIMPFSN